MVVSQFAVEYAHIESTSVEFSSVSRVKI
jgi:hypothetical protein